LRLRCQTPRFRRLVGTAVRYHQYVIVAFRITFQAQNVDAIRADVTVCVIKIGPNRYKALQVAWGADGSLFVTFPYFEQTEGILSASYLPGNGKRETVIDLEDGGKVSSHLVKYAHHVSGEAHFSQTGKIITGIRRQSLPLGQQDGHIFTLQVQGLAALKLADPVKDAVGRDPKRSVIDFECPPTNAIKFVGRWYDVTQMMLDRPTPTVGPWIPSQYFDGTSGGKAWFIGQPSSANKQLLAITLRPIQKFSKDRETLLFYGGFDAREAMEDPTKDGGFLMFKYPIGNPAVVASRIGTVDYNKPKN
jgi:hypothetical protein